MPVPDETTGKPSPTARKPLSRSEAARHASLVRWGKEQPFAARLEAVKERRKAAKKAKARGGGKGKAAKPDKAAEAEKERLANIASVGDALSEAENEHLSRNGLAGLMDAASGKEPPPNVSQGLIDAGMAVRGEDGRYRLTSEGRGILGAAERGDTNAVLDKLSELNDKNVAKQKRELEKGKGKEKDKRTEGEEGVGTVADLARDMQKVGDEAKEDQKEEKPKGGGGGGGGKKKETPEEKKEAQAKERAATASATAPKVGLRVEEVSSLRASAEGGRVAEADVDGLVEMGLVEADAAGSFRATDQGRRALTALERGDVRQYRAAVDDAQARLGREKAKGERDTAREAERLARDEERSAAEEDRAAAEEERAAARTARKERIQTIALRRFEKTGKLSATQEADLEDAGLIEYDDEGTPKLTAEGRKRLQKQKSNKGERVQPIEPMQATKHMPGAHDQRSHGRSTARRAGARAAYTSARAGGASIKEARAKANDVSQAHANQQRIANIDKQLGGAVSDKQRSSLEAEKKRLTEDTQRRAARTPDAGNVGAQEPTVRGRQKPAEKDTALSSKHDLSTGEGRTAAAMEKAGLPVSVLPINNQAASDYYGGHEAVVSKLSKLPKEDLDALAKDSHAQWTSVASGPSRDALDRAAKRDFKQTREYQQQLINEARQRQKGEGATVSPPAGKPSGVHAPLRAPVSGDLAAEARWRQQKQDAAAQRKAQRDKAKANIQRITAIQKEINSPRTSLARLRELQQELSNIRAGKSIEGTDMDYADILETIEQATDELLVIADDTEIKAGARHSASDTAIIQAIYDNACDLCEMAVALGASEEMGGEEEEDEEEDDYEGKAQQTFGGKKRGDLDDEDFAGPGRTFPIVTAADVSDAASLLGKAENPEQVKRNIIRIAKRKGFPLPKAWEAGATKGIEVFDLDGEEVVTLAGYGVKALADGNGWVGGYLVRFGGDGDLSQWRDVFGRDTDYGRATKSDVWVHHRMLPGVGKRRLANQAEIGLDDEGVFIKHLLDLRSSYERKLYDLAQADKLGWSSGTAPHLVERKSLGDGRHKIDQWPLGLDASYTPMPAGGVGVEARAGAMKSLLEDAGIDLIHITYEASIADDSVKSIYDNQEAPYNDTHDRPDAVKVDAERARRLLLELDLMQLEATTL